MEKALTQNTKVREDVSSYGPAKIATVRQVPLETRSFKIKQNTFLTPNTWLSSLTQST